MNLLAKAIRIASVAFEDIIDKGGQPYILHLLWVMNAVRHLGETYMIVAVLHDLMEDFPDTWTRDLLISEGFTLDIVIALDILNHRKEDSYEHYIQMISHNEYARAVKLRDLEHNSKITRLKGLRKKDFDRLEKYNKAYVYLSN